MPEDEKDKTKADDTTKVTHQDEGDGGPASTEQLLGELKAALQGKDVEVGAGQSGILNAAIEFVKAVEEEAPPSEGEGEGGEGGEMSAEAASTRKQLGLDSNATTEEVVNALKAKNAHVGFTSNKEVTAMRQRLEVLETENAETKGKALREKYAMKLNPNDKEQMAWAVETSVKSPETFERLVKNAPDALPPQGQTGDVPVKTNRETVVASVKTEWKGSPEFQQLNPNVEVAIYGELRDKGLLTTEEEAAHKYIAGTR